MKTSIEKDKRKEIHDYLTEEAWGHILDNILGDEYKDKNGSIDKRIGYDIEKILKSVAATFGLLAMSE